MKKSRLHFMGIGGQGISAVAQMALTAGDTVTGCDQLASATTRALERAGIAVQIGHSAEHLAECDLLVISPAVPALNSHNPELVAAQAQRIQVVTWQQLLGELMRGRCVLSVSGVHGKGTTTAMLALMLVDAGLDPTCEIGAVVPRFGVNYRLGKSEYFVNEADEFNHNFWYYHPRLVVVTSIEFEHPEFFTDYAAFLAAFEHFIRGMDMQGDWPLPPTLILNADSPGCLELRERLGDWPGRIVTYAVEGLSVSQKDRNVASKQKKQMAFEKEGFPASKRSITDVGFMLSKETQATFEAYDVKLAGETSFRVQLQNGEDFGGDRIIHLQLPGAHNIQNALAALAAAYTVGVHADTIIKTLEGFGGIRRRFEIRHAGPLQVNGQMPDVILVDDYAHHPTAIAATLEAAHSRYPERRLVAVYQPHMFSRTKTFFEQFLQAFDIADVVIIADIFPARERDTGLIHSRDLVEAMARRHAMHGGDVQATAQLVRNILRSGDLVLIMGAGDIYVVTERLLQDTFDDIQC